MCSGGLYGSKISLGFPGGSDVKWGTWVRSLGQEDPPGERHCNSLKYSCLENPMDRGAWRATAHGIPKVSDVTERLSIQDKSDFFIVSSGT